MRIPTAVLLMILTSTCGSPNDDEYVDTSVVFPSINKIDPRYQALVDEFSDRCKAARLRCNFNFLELKEVDKIDDTMAGYATRDGRRVIVVVTKRSPRTGEVWTPQQSKYIVFHELFHAILHREHTAGTENELMSAIMPDLDAIEEHLEQMIDDAF